ncbi:hypothetical protein FNH05_01625 [Amycolatopsis rhizosphaerae]|uniref:Uncharacterized protein n=1 Tax=Amycolatopsis rhizosphaerae TaxID=2053003 RepID=A0A558DLP9_9PSEU|nr:hypothetical protein [Amycolatopsis rhizosphaerae]TVT61960.1 hypothetical protein FNH05_01625 [Amycolatopsis rhizosphaerae]
MTLTAIFTLIVLVVAVAAAVLIAHYLTRPDKSRPAGTPAPSAPAGPDSAAAEENALAARPMVQLPAQAAQPQVMTTMTAGPDIDVPDPAITIGQWIPGGFPETPEGALGQLKALNETALTAADPQVYARAYRELSLPGAPDPGLTGLYSLLTSLRSRAGLPATGSVAGMSATYEINYGQIKGTAADGRYVVVCVLGQFSVTVQGQVVAAGVGDCQAMRWTGSTWRMAPGALAAPAPSAWPGSADAVKAGYREVR